MSTWIPPILATALIYGLTAEEATAWAAALGTIITGVVAVLENLIRKIGRAIIDVMNSRGEDDDVRFAAIESRLAAAESTAQATTTSLATANAGVLDVRAAVDAVAARVAALEPTPPAPTVAGAGA